MTIRVKKTDRNKVCQNIVYVDDSSVRTLNYFQIIAHYPKPETNETPWMDVSTYTIDKSEIPSTWAFTILIN